MRTNFGPVVGQRVTLWTILVIFASVKNQCLASVGHVGLVSPPPPVLDHFWTNFDQFWRIVHQSCAFWNHIWTIFWTRFPPFWAASGNRKKNMLHTQIKSELINMVELAEVNKHVNLNNETKQRTNLKQIDDTKHESNKQHRKKEEGR